MAADAALVAAAGGMSLLLWCSGHLAVPLSRQEVSSQWAVHAVRARLYLGIRKCATPCAHISVCGRAERATCTCLRVRACVARWRAHQWRIIKKISITINQPK